MLEDRLQKKLADRQNKNALRELTVSSSKIDFCSNDYLGFSKKEWKSSESHGATGSRLISGNSQLHQTAEKLIADFHETEAALLFNSGYNANLGLLSCVPQKEDTIIYDQLCHASIRDGIKLGLARNFSFKHNDTFHLEEKLKQASGIPFVIVESVYSMDGDFAPLQEIMRLCQTYNAHLIIDEAHALGVFGKGLAHSIDCFAKIYTYGKAMGSHGAAIVGSKTLIHYLINFSRPLIYTTALSPQSVARIMWAYEEVERCTNKEKLMDNISLFKEKCKHPQLIPSSSAIQCIIIGGNEQTKRFAKHLQVNNFDVRPILHPTVAEGSERLRICLHSFNTPEEISKLCDLINLSV